MVKKYLNTTIKLSAQDVEILKEIAPPRDFGKGQSEVIYKGQIPLSAYIVYSGCLILQDKNKKSFVKPLQMIFLEDSYHKRPIQFDVMVESDSVIGFLDRSTLLEIISNNEHLLMKNIKLKEALRELNAINE